MPDYQACISRKQKYLYDLNIELLTICLKWLNIKITITESVSYENPVPPDTLDARNTIHPKKPDSVNKLFKPTTYHQVFGKPFVSNLSLIDLVMCEGPNARHIVLASAASGEQLKR